MKINVANKKYVIFPIYRATKQNTNYSLGILSEGLDFHLKHFENICILCDFDATSSNPRLTMFLEICDFAIQYFAQS